MKVLIVTGIFPPDIGGPATYVPLMARSLIGRGHEVQVVTTSESRTARLTSTIVRAAAGADLVYAVGMHLEAAIGARVARRRLIVKIVGDYAWERARERGWTEDGFERFQHVRQRPRVEALKRMRAWPVRRADGVIVPSAYLKRTVEGWGVAPERCRIVYNAVSPPTQLRPVSPLRAGGVLRVLTVGRLIPIKGVDVLIRALRDVPGARLDVVGDGPCRPGLDTLARTLGLGERVRFHGNLRTGIVRALMRQHDVLALASVHEGLPHVVLEAMQEGLAVVATRVGGTPELIDDGHTGLLVEPRAADIAAGLDRLRRDPALRRKIVGQALLALEERFSVRAMVDRTEEVLRTAVDPGAAAPGWLAPVQSAG